MYQSTVHERTLGTRLWSKLFTHWYIDDIEEIPLFPPLLSSIFRTSGMKGCLGQEKLFCFGETCDGLPREKDHSTNVPLCFLSEFLFNQVCFTNLYKTFSRLFSSVLRNIVTNPSFLPFKNVFYKNVCKVAVFSVSVSTNVGQSSFLMSAYQEVFNELS